MHLRPGRAAALVSLATALAIAACSREAVAPETSATSAPETAPPAAGDTCPRFSSGERVGKVADPGLAEISGLAASRTNAGVLWAQEDSGSPADLVAIRPDGTLVRTFHLTGVSARDWEDVAVGPGPERSVAYVYLADIGDNLDDQRAFHVVRVREPSVDPSTGAKATDLRGAVTLTGRYPDGSHNAETLLTDPLTGDLFVVTKSDKGRSGVYRWPAPQREEATTTLEAAGSIDVGSLDGAIDVRVTAGDISPDGSMILLRTYTNAWVWHRDTAETVVDALARPPCTAPLALEQQGEAIAWDATGDGYYSTTEGSRPAIMRYSRE